MPKPIQAPLPIGAVERDTGIGKDTLRVWERRYGFPQPLRSEGGERLYPQPQVERLRLIRKLLDQGHRPGKIVPLEPPRLERLLADGNRPGPAQPSPEGLYGELLQAIAQRDPDRQQQQMLQAVARLGLHRFILEVLAPTLREVGQLWARGKLEIIDEHLFSHLVKRVLHQAMTQLPAGSGAWRALLTTLPGERHNLGILMVEAILASRGVATLSLGAETPIDQIELAVRSQRIGLVALSFSEHYRRTLAEDLQLLRARLPRQVAILAGGGGIAQLKRPLAGITLLGDLGHLVDLDLATLFDGQTTGG
jgi:DNA-binding transcriptional MerR regulator/methylmalonyl-CoA mutase cobalamin-binding subunit